MKNRKFAYLLLGAAALAGLTACGASQINQATTRMMEIPSRSRPFVGRIGGKTITKVF